MPYLGFSHGKALLRPNDIRDLLRVAVAPDIFHLPLAITVQYEPRRRFGFARYEIVRDLGLELGRFTVNAPGSSHLHTHDAIEVATTSFTSFKTRTIGSAQKEGKRRCPRIRILGHPSASFLGVCTGTHT